MSTTYLRCSNDSKQNKNSKSMKNKSLSLLLFLRQTYVFYIDRLKLK